MVIWPNMLVYRIALAKYAHSLNASGRAVRWNPNDTEVIYTSSSRALACLENIVHRSQLGFNELYCLMIIEVDNSVKNQIVKLKELPADWKEFGQTLLTQRIGEKWLKENKTAVLQVPSSIIEEECNYLLNIKHPDFKKITLTKTEVFSFDNRLKH